MQSGNSVMENDFLKAVLVGNVEAVISMLETNRLLVFARDIDDDSALHLACNANHPFLVKALLAFGASVHVTGCSCRTPLHCATCERNIECVKILLTSGAPLDDDDSLQENPLHKAATNGDVNILQLFLECLQHLGGASNPAVREIVNHKNVLGSAPIHNAAHHGHTSIVKMLAAFGADVNSEDNFGMPPFQIALNRGYKECAENLFELANSSAKSQKQTIVSSTVSMQE